jgi:hypothetical protein
MKVALVCIAKNEDHYIEEWINYHLKLGFDDIIIYRNNWEYSNDNPRVKVIDYPGQVRQIPAYNEFISQNLGIYDWVAFFDVDEFLALKKHSNVKEFLNDYGNYNTVGINWAIFGSNGIESVSDNYNVLERFTKRQVSVDQHIKSIVKIRTGVAFGTPHNVNVEWVSPELSINRGPFNKNGSDEIAQLNHYFCKSKDEFIQKVSRGRADTNQFRSLEEFNHLDINEVEDLHALNFYQNKL